MAPNLPDSQHAHIHDMILSNNHPAEIADIVGCSERSVLCDTVKPSSFRLHESGPAKTTCGGCNSEPYKIRVQNKITECSELKPILNSTIPRISPVSIYDIALAIHPYIASDCSEAIASGYS